MHSPAEERRPSPRGSRHRDGFSVRPRGRRGKRLTERAVAGCLVLLAVGAVVLDQAVGTPEISSSAALPATVRQDATPSAPASLTFSSGVSADTGVARAAAAQDPRPLDQGPGATARPARLVIQAIGVDVDLSQLARRGDGTLEPPKGLMEAGWYTDSAVPGTVGPAVIAGHVDDTEDAGIFSRLHELAPGAEIEIVLTDGSTEVFSVDGSADVAKKAFPTDAVYGATRTPELRLITCNGPYDFGAMHYSNNLVVFASKS